MSDEEIQGGFVSEIELQDLYQRVLEVLQTGVYLIDKNERIFFWNEGAEKITGHLRQDVLGRHRHEVIQTDEEEREGEEASRNGEHLKQVLRDGKPTYSEALLRHKDGHLVPARMRAVAIRNDHGTIIAAAESFEENLATSEWERRQEKLADYGALDSATGVLTESFLLSHLRESLRTFGECQVPFSVVCVHVDKIEDFKARYGPGVISVLLRVAGQTLENSLRPTDFLGRKGEMEFLSILTECSRFDIGRVCERLKSGVQGIRVNWWGDRLPVNASLGATTVLPDDSPENILARVERALQISLRSGGNRITFLQEPEKMPEAEG